MKSKTKAISQRLYANMQALVPMRGPAVAPENSVCGFSGTSGEIKDLGTILVDGVFTTPIELDDATVNTPIQYKEDSPIDDGTIELDLKKGSVFIFTHITNELPITFANVPSGAHVSIILHRTKDSSPEAKTFILPSNVDYSGGKDKLPITQEANATDSYNLMTGEPGRWIISMISKNPIV